MNRLSIIVPTIGRPTLRRTLDSITPQLKGGDEVLVIADGHLADVEALCVELGPAFRYLTWSVEGSCVGHAQRNAGILAARGDYVTFIGDDDIYTPGALEVIKRSITEQPGALFLFRVNTWSCGVVWRSHSHPSLRLGQEPGNIDASCAVFPNNGKLGAFTYRYEGDFDFIRQSLWKNPGKGVWKEEVIVICRPERFESLPK